MAVMQVCMFHTMFRHLQMLPWEAIYLGATSCAGLHLYLKLVRIGITVELSIYQLLGLVS